MVRMVLSEDIVTSTAYSAARVSKDPLMVNWRVVIRPITIDMNTVKGSPRSTTQAMAGTGTYTPPIHIRSQDIGSPRGSIGP